MGRRGRRGGCGRESRVTSGVRGRRKPRSGYKVGEFDNAKGIAHVGGRKREGEGGGTVVGCSLVYKTFKRLFLFRCDSMHSIAKTCLPACLVARMPAVALLPFFPTCCYYHRVNPLPSFARRASPAFHPSASQPSFLSAFQIDGFTKEGQRGGTTEGIETDIYVYMEKQVKRSSCRYP